MKKLLVVLLSLGLIAAFSMPAAAVDFKMGGEWYTYGIYYANRTLVDEDNATSRAWIYTQTRLQPEIQVAEGLKLVMRADALSKFWGGTNWRKGYDDKTSSRKQDNVNTGTGIADMKIQENIEIERSYVVANTGIGQFQIGYRATGNFGPDFAGDTQSRPRFMYTVPVGPVKILAIYDKYFESDHSNYNARLGEFVDNDDQQYALAAIYGFEGGEAGFLYKYVANNSNRIDANGGFRTKIHAFDPYVTMTIGPVELEAEFVYMTGKGAEFDDPSIPDYDIKGYGGMLKAKVGFGPAYVGGMILYSSGDDDPNDDTDETGPASPDAAYGYIMLKDWEDSDTWPAIGGPGGVEIDDSLTNMTMFQLYAGFDPTEKLNVEVKFLTAKANEVPADFVSDNIGTEIGAQATYKIFDNLSYMVAGAYYFAGDIFKGTNDAYKVGNDYMLYNKLTLEW